MRHPLFQKCVLLLIISLLLMLPLSMIQSAIDERTQFRDQATRAIAAATAGPQTLTGPVLIFPVDEYFDEENIERRGSQTTKRIVRSVLRHQIAIAPKQLHFDGDMKVEKRAYGLYDTNVFSLQERISGNFEAPDASVLPRRNASSRLVWGSPALILGRRRSARHRRRAKDPARWTRAATASRRAPRRRRHEAAGAASRRAGSR